MRMPFLLVPLYAGIAQLSLAAELTVTIENITELTGTVNWSVFDSEKAYTEDLTPVLTARSRADRESLKLTLHDLPSGRYAIKLFHDANDNGKLDSNLVGIPQEGYGFSNNAGRFGPASFEDAAVTVDGTTQISIRLR